MPDENLNFPPQKGDSHGYYRVLNTTVDATCDEIYHAWETKLIDNHPDLNWDKSTLEELESRLRRINQAFKVLYDPVLRSRYDGHELDKATMDREFTQSLKEFEAKVARGKAIQRKNEEELRESLDDEARERPDQACQEQKQLAQDAAEKKSLAGAAMYTVWSIMFLALTPTLSDQVLRIPTTDYIVNPTLTSSLVHGLAVALLCLGVNTKIFVLDTTLKKRINDIIIGAQLLSIFVLAI